MNRRTKLAVLASGNGSNLQAIMDEIRAGSIPADLDVVVSNRRKAFALERAARGGIETRVFPPRSFATREEYDDAIADFLTGRGVDLVVLAGYMRILSPGFVRCFFGRLINIHPALLPRYPGLNAIERAFEAGDQTVGVTVHFVDEGVDSGPIILQEELPVRPDDTLETLTERVHALEHRLYPEAIRRFIRGDARSEERS